MNLVIVESPTKAKTIKRFLGKGYSVISSYGHIRDLPKNNMGIDIKSGFKPEYEVPENSKKQVSILKKHAKDADKIYFATDEDREGEAIAWHLKYLLKPKKENSKRIAFHEITKKAITDSLENPREIDQNLVDAQQARRVLDRLVGYELSPFLWKKVRMGLSAGRVQSAAVRMIVDRENEIRKFKPDEYWTIEAELGKKDSPKKDKFIAKLAKKDGKIIKKLDIKDNKQAEEITSDLKDAEYKITEIKKNERKKFPSPPFTTSTMQQEAAKKLYFSAKQTMMIAQQLYEGIEIGEGKPIGLITYMRTDSVNLSKEALSSSQNFIKKEYGDGYGLEKFRFFKKKSKLAQEAHEAIRPSSIERTPDSIRQYLNPKQFKLYDLIWRRMTASQMKEAIMDATTVDISAKNYLFRATGSIIKFDGFLKIYKTDTKEKLLPILKKEEILKLLKLHSNKHSTEPLPRYTEASLVKTMEEQGIGRPSTYAPTISTIQQRGYVKKNDDRKFEPTETGELVNKVLVEHFPKIVDLKFTAQMEKELDDIANGKIKWVPVIKEFYEPFKKNLKKKDKEVSKKELTEEKTKETCDKCGKPMVIKMGRFGKFMACSGYPACKNTKPLAEEKAKQDALQKQYAHEKCDKCGAQMKVKRGRYGEFLGCSNYPKCKGIKPIEKKTGAGCPKCGNGDIIEKRSKKGRTFYACNKFPECEFALWQKPNGEVCPKCKSLLVFAAGKKIKCSNKECDFVKGQ
ncbi:MAG: hypothetical protein ACD_63C00213G0002 [uncultured bacterium]|nr:MAG: hypothetical protein ACD_63C00213G0002 [uncultured bacterium]